MTEPSDFSRFELMLLHRLTTLELLTKEQHAAFEDLRVDLATLKTKVDTRAALMGGGVGIIVSLAAALLKFFAS